MYRSVSNLTPNYQWCLVLLFLMLPALASIEFISPTGGGNINTINHRFSFGASNEEGIWTFATDEEKAFTSFVNYKGKILNQFEVPFKTIETLNTYKTVQMKDSSILHFFQTGTFSSSASCYLVKTDNSGQENWSKILEIGGIERTIQKVKELSDGTILIATTTPHTANHSCELALIKIDTDGALISESIVSINENDCLDEIQLLADGSAYLNFQM